MVTEQATQPAARSSAFKGAEHLRNESEIGAYVEAMLEDGDARAVTIALRTVAEAVGMTALAERTCLSRETLYRTLSKDGNPRLDTLAALLDALGLRLAVRPVSRAERKPLAPISAVPLPSQQEGSVDAVRQGLRVTTEPKSRASCPAFKLEQRRELEHIGLTDMAIGMLQEVLPRLSDNQRNKAPSKTEVRGRTQKISKPLAQAAESIEQLEKAHKKFPTPLTSAIYEAFEEQFEQIKSAARRLAEAERQLLQGFSGRREAQTWPIGLIKSELDLAAFFDSGCKKDARNVPVGSTLRVSRSGTFATIACICYAAAGIQGPGGAAHLRAINAYNAARNYTGRRRKAGRPRKLVR